MNAATPAAVARRFLAALEAMDIDAALAAFAEDGVQEMPFAPPGFPTRLDGTAALRRQYGGLPSSFSSMSFDITAEHPSTDGEHVWLEYRGTIHLRTGGRYDNTYAGLFRVVDGRITTLREYFDPLVLQDAFGDATAETFSLEP